eukprot:TRINITY_DN2968_c0_g1_i1.p1 TRINITY_DN2968_c0_g1~~TRINITY_DN2968_c0_g1_i1.p1  ORF type:complete len:174 (-),score=51.40 TRINITY_DN2968_c0_g1_i1:5-526(-)
MFARLLPTLFFFSLSFLPFAFASSCGLPGFDLSPLRSAVDFQIWGSNQLFVLNVCGPLQKPSGYCDPNSENPNLCSGGFVMGSANNVTFEIAEDGLGLVQTSYAVPEGIYSSQIHFICSYTAGLGSPQWNKQDGKRFHFTWISSAACSVCGTQKTPLLQLKNDSMDYVARTLR